VSPAGKPGGNCRIGDEESKSLGDSMATTFLKRQKEMKRQEKQREKAERRKQKKLAQRTERVDSVESVTSAPLSGFSERNSEK
jgi:threonyl-tRNA synthetase